jgi:hypothetical protein
VRRVWRAALGGVRLDELDHKCRDVRTDAKRDDLVASATRREQLSGGLVNSTAGHELGTCATSVESVVQVESSPWGARLIERGHESRRERSSHCELDAKRDELVASGVALGGVDS